MQYDKLFFLNQTNHGIKTEPFARKKYEELMIKTNFVLKLTGLYNNENFPELGASPIGLTNCTRHEKGILKIKCPFKYKDRLNTWENNKNFPIDNQTMTLKVNHLYYYQMQRQVMINEHKFYDFFVWFVDGFILDSISRKRILWHVKCWEKCLNV